jgi:phosphate-selective porin OprO/OprP
MRARWVSILVIFAVAGLRSIAAQTSSDSDIAALQQRVRQLEELVSRLEQRVNELQPAPAKQVEQPAAPAAAATQERLDALDDKVKLLENMTQVKEQPLVNTGRNTFSISSSDGLYRLRIGGHLQEDGKFFYDNNTYYSQSPHQLVDNFNLRRARPILEGDLGHYVYFRFTPDFGNGKVLLYDAWADVKPSPYLSLRGGKFKDPLGLEQLQGDADLTFIERSLATDLVPNRDEGFEVFGNVKGFLEYQVAAINSAPVGQSIDGATNRGKDLVTRVFLTPFAHSGTNMLKGLGFGAAASTGRQEGSVLPTFLTTGGQAAFFSYGVGSGSSAIVPMAAGRRLNYTPQLYYYNGPFGLIAEWVDSSQRISAVVKNNTVVRDIDNYAWQAAGSWVLTGEKKSFRGVVPRKGLEGGKAGLGIGAWEIAARYTALSVDPTAFTAGFADPTKSARSARAWTVGLHWYLNYFVKLQFEYEQTHFNGGNVADSNRPTEKVFEQRLQFAF